MSDVADRGELPLSYVSALEAARIELPSPERRRQIARALEVRHIDILIACGQITDDEVPGMSHAPLYARYPGLHATIDRLPRSAAVALHDLLAVCSTSSSGT